MGGFNYISVDKQETDNAAFELTFDDIAGLESVLTSVPYFLLSDNLDNDLKLDREYIESISKNITANPFKIRFNMAMFCMSGSIDIRLNLEHYHLSPGSVLLVYEGMICDEVRIDPDSKLFFIGFSGMFVRASVLPFRYKEGISKLFESPVIGLSEGEFNDLEQLYMICKTRFLSPEFRFKEQMAHNIMEMMAYILIDRASSDESRTIPIGRRHLLVRRFMELVGSNAISRRDISYYADALNITPKYLSQIVSDTTGSTPHTLICRQVLLEAKALLSDPSLNIQQVSDRLNFPNPSFFGTFFRRHTGMTPKTYKNLHTR